MNLATPPGVVGMPSTAGISQVFSLRDESVVGPPLAVFVTIQAYSSDTRAAIRVR